MKFWTIQHKDVLDIILSEGVYYPDFNKGDKKIYGDMRTVYPVILSEYNKRNNKKLEGVIFGFGNIRGKCIRYIHELYDYLKNNPDVSGAFKFWSDDYCILKLEIEDDVDLVPIDFNDFIKIGIAQTNDIEKIKLLELVNYNYSFKEDIRNIVSDFQEGICTPVLPSFTEIHYSHLSKDNIVEIYNMINYEDGKIYELNKSARELKKKINVKSK